MKDSEKNDKNIKSLEDFNGDHQAYADYLESAECADDMGYDIQADSRGNIYERTNGSWRNGHGHNNTNDPRPPRDPNSESSKGRKWKNNWLIENEFSLNEDEVSFIMNNNSKVKNFKRR